MQANSFGQLLTLTTFGESHGPGLGAVIDGCPAGLTLSLNDIQIALNRRRPGQSAITTSRQETDQAEIISGIYENKTLGTPICILVRNHNARSHDYDPSYYRVGHADKVWEEKFGHRDHRGGGRASGRETLGRVIGGVVAQKVLPQTVQVHAFTRQVGDLYAQNIPPQLSTDIVDAHPTRCPDKNIAEKITQELLYCKKHGDSRGGVAELWIDNLPIGLGEPVFAKAKNLLCNALMSIGGVIGVTLGDAINDCMLRGQKFHNDFSASAPGISTSANGIQGGMTNGQRVILRVYFKPASTIGSMAREGRHDPCIIPRAIPVLEAMANLVLADLYLASKINREWFQ